jgi:hypothetical protein
MLEMAALERAEPDLSLPRSPRRWGARESLSLLGGVIFVTALGLLAYLFLTRPVPPQMPSPPSPETIRRETQAFSPVESLRAWQMLHARGLVRSEVRDDRYQKQLFVWHLWLGVVATIALVGVALLVTPLLTKPRAAAGHAGSATRSAQPTRAPG